MKRLRSLLIAVLLIISIVFCSFSVCAESIDYKLKELGMTISISDTMTVKSGVGSDLPQNIYLEATNADRTLKLSISMIKDANTKKVDTFQGKSSAFLDEYKSSMEALGFSEGKDATYGDVPFLDFSQKTSTESGADIYSRHSITFINGMSVSIVSESAGDNFTSDELALIKASLESISFDTVVQQKKVETKKTAKSWILGIFLVLAAAGAVVFVVYKKKQANKRKALLRERSKKTDYDIFKTTDYSDAPAQNRISGYKTSADFFDKHFDAPSKKEAQKQSSKVSAMNTPAEKTSAFTRIGYFAKNLGREINKAKNKSKKSKQNRKAVDYDIFSEK